MMSEPGGIGYDKARVDALEYQVNALEDQVVVDTAIIKAHNVEIKRLRDALDFYGEHSPDCGAVQVPEEPVCTCGLVQPPYFDKDRSEYDSAEAHQDCVDIASLLPLSWILVLQHLSLLLHPSWLNNSELENGKAIPLKEYPETSPT